MYVDDVLIISEHGEDVLREEIGKHFKLKEESIGPLSFYLSGKLCRVSLDNGSSSWAFGSSKYIQASVDNIELYLRNGSSKVPSRCNTPTSTKYRPELDTSKKGNPEDATQFQSLIGVLRWIVELGRVDIVVKCPCCLPHYLCHVKATWNRSITSLRISRNTTMRRWCLIHLILV